MSRAIHHAGSDDANKLPLFVTTRVAARAIGVGEGTLKELARTLPDFPRPITLLSKSPTHRQFRWPIAAVLDYLSKPNALTVPADALTVEADEPRPSHKSKQKESRQKK